MKEWKYIDLPGTGITVRVDQISRVEMHKRFMLEETEVRGAYVAVYFQEGHSVLIRCEEGDESAQAIKEWIDSYLVPDKFSK
jgi:hypothetical protein